MLSFHEHEDNPPAKRSERDRRGRRGRISHRASGNGTVSSAPVSPSTAVSCGLVHAEHAEAWILCRTTGAEPMTTTALGLPTVPSSGQEEQLQQHKPEEVSRRRFLFVSSRSRPTALSERSSPSPSSATCSAPVMKREGRRAGVGLGPRRSISRGRDPPRQFSRPVHGAHRRTDRDLPALGAAHRSGTSSRYFAINCAHLGCPGALVFAVQASSSCPCHGGAYYQDGLFALRTAGARPV